MSPHVSSEVLTASIIERRRRKNMAWQEKPVAPQQDAKTQSSGQNLASAVGKLHFN